MACLPGLTWARWYGDPGVAWRCQIRVSGSSVPWKMSALHGVFHEKMMDKLWENMGKRWKTSENMEV